MLLIGTLSVLGSCSLEAEETGAVGKTFLASSLPAEAEALALYDELSTRMNERGVMIEEMRAAADAGDEEAVRKLFGYTPEEFDATYERLLALAQGRERGRGGGGGGGEGPGTGIGPPEHAKWLKCNGVIFTPCILAAAERASHVPGKVALAIYAVGGLACAWISCSWDGTGPGTRTSRP